MPVRDALCLVELRPAWVTIRGACSHYGDWFFLVPVATTNWILTLIPNYNTSLGWFLLRKIVDRCGYRLSISLSTPTVWHSIYPLSFSRLRNLRWPFCLRGLIKYAKDLYATDGHHMLLLLLFWGNCWIPRHYCLSLATFFKKTSQNEVHTILIQWHANQWQGILQLSCYFYHFLYSHYVLLRIRQFNCIVGNSELNLGVNAETVFFIRSLDLALVLLKQIERNLALALVLSFHLERSPALAMALFE